MVRLGTFCICVVVLTVAAVLLCEDQPLSPDWWAHDVTPVEVFQDDYSIYPEMLGTWKQVGIVWPDKVEIERYTRRKLVMDSVGLRLYSYPILEEGTTTRLVDAGIIELTSIPVNKDHPLWLTLSIVWWKRGDRLWIPWGDNGVVTCWLIFDRVKP